MKSKSYKVQSYECSRLESWSIRPALIIRETVMKQFKIHTSFFLVVLILVLNFLSEPTLLASDNRKVKNNGPSEIFFHPRKKSLIKRQWGIDVLYIRQSAAGYMLEFRYKVLDAEKAKGLFKRQIKPLLTHIESGAKLIVPTPAKTGALRNSNIPLTGQTYWMFFANPGQLVKPGDHVDIEIGDFQVKSLIVR